MSALATMMVVEVGSHSYSVAALMFVSSVLGMILTPDTVASTGILGWCFYYRGLIITYTILGAPDYDYSIIYPKTLF